MTPAALIIDIIEIWFVIGAVVAAVFLTIGVDRIDEDARGAYAFRPLLVPGILLIWPLVIWRWLVLEIGERNWMARYKPPRAIHLPVAIIFACAVGFSVIAGVAVKQTWPGDIAPVQLEDPAT